MERKPQRPKPDFKPRYEIELDKIKRKLGADYITLVLSNDKDVKEYLNKVSAITETFADQKHGITSSQIRKVFSRVKRIKSDALGELQMLRPQLAYMAGRAEQGKSQNGPTTKAFAIFLDELIQNVDNEAKLINFKQFFEAIVAYHKFHGGK
jgi:CRISPR type III-A-associated protein Csm2